jgi:hypothetical protein
MSLRGHSAFQLDVFSHLPVSAYDDYRNGSPLPQDRREGAPAPRRRAASGGVGHPGKPGLGARAAVVGGRPAPRGPLDGTGRPGPTSGGAAPAGPRLGHAAKGRIRRLRAHRPTDERSGCARVCLPTVTRRHEPAGRRPYRPRRLGQWRVPRRQEGRGASPVPPPQLRQAARSPTASLTRAAATGQGSAVRPARLRRVTPRRAPPRALALPSGVALPTKGAGRCIGNRRSTTPRSIGDSRCGRSPIG